MKRFDLWFERRLGGWVLAHLELLVVAYFGGIGVAALVIGALR